jgi:hypothetical protein
MLTQLLESLRKVSESSLNAGQEMFKQWVQHAQPQSLGGSGTPQEWTDSFQKRWAESAAEALNKHRELVDATYRSGIEVIEQSFRAGEARSLGENRRLVEELWRRLSDTYKAQTEAQFREFQNATASWLAMARGGSAARGAQPTHSQAGQ